MRWSPTGIRKNVRSTGESDPPPDTPLGIHAPNEPMGVGVWGRAETVAWVPLPLRSRTVVPSPAAGAFLRATLHPSPVAMQTHGWTFGRVEIHKNVSRGRSGVKEGTCWLRAFRGGGTLRTKGSKEGAALVARPVGDQTRPQAMARGPPRAPNPVATLDHQFGLHPRVPLGKDPE